MVDHPGNGTPTKCMRSRARPHNLGSSSEEFQFPGKHTKRRCGTCGEPNISLEKVEGTTFLFPMLEILSLGTNFPSS